MTTKLVTKEKALHFRTHVVHKALNKIQLAGENAEELLLGTAIQESRLTFRRQLGDGPARGLFQMEPATHDDIWDNYLKYHHLLAAQVKALLKNPKTKNKAEELESNDIYACAMARVHYLRAPGVLPQQGDLAAMAAYWKKYYNTAYGAGTPEEYERNWHIAMG